MPHDDLEIESLLKRQPLRQPTARLDDRIDAVLGEVMVYRWVKWAAALAACAMIAVTLFLMTRGGGGGAASGSRDKVATKTPLDGNGDTTATDFNPVRIEQVWSQVQPEGVIMVDGDAMRRYHRQTFERVQLIDDARNIRIEYTVPHNDVIVMPVKYD